MIVIKNIPGLPKADTPSCGVITPCAHLSLQDASFPSSLLLVPAQARGTISTQVDLQPSVCLSNPLSTAEPSVACKITGGWWENATPELTPVQWRLAKRLTPWGAVTCFPFNSSINLTGARFEFSVLAVPINSPHTVRFQALFLLILDCCLCGTAPHRGNYWGCVGRIKFLVKECAVISLLLQPPLHLLHNRRCSGASSSFHSYLLISSDIFQGWFSCCFRDIFQPVHLAFC